MKKAILKTLIYADIFNYPLKAREIHKWLIGRKVNLRQLEKTLEVSRKYYFLSKRNNLVSQRLRREKQSVKFFKKAKILVQLLKLIPWIKLVGISGGLAMNNAGEKDDIDLFIITDKNRLWISRLLALGILSLTGQRRKRQDKGKRAAGKLCINILLEEDRLEQRNKDIFTAHEVLQMKVLWQRNGIYSQYLEDNSWAFKFLPNWITDINSVEESKRSQCNVFFDMSEKLAMWLQLKIMQKPQGRERIETGALYFHPDDCRLKVLQEYKKKLAALDK